MFDELLELSGRLEVTSEAVAKSRCDDVELYSGLYAGVYFDVYVASAEKWRGFEGVEWRGFDGVDGDVDCVPGSVLNGSDVTSGAAEDTVVESCISSPNVECCIFSSNVVCCISSANVVFCMPSANVV